MDMTELLRHFSLEKTAKQLKAKRQAEINIIKRKVADIKAQRSKTFEDFSAAIIDEDT